MKEYKAKLPEKSESNDFRNLLSLYQMHQNQLQQAFSIITAIGVGGVAAIAVLFAVSDLRLGVIAVASLFFAISFVFLIIGLMNQKDQIAEEKERLLVLLAQSKQETAVETYRYFLSLPRRIVNFSLGLLIIEDAAYFIVFIIAFLSVLKIL